MRARIRTLKPEVWADEKIGALSRDARLLFVGLVTMADDEGRIRALPAAILGHVYPYDRIPARKLRTWIDELVSVGIVIEYAHESTPYLAFPHWTRHQRITRPSASRLPKPPTQAENTLTIHEHFTEPSVNARRGIGSDQDLTPYSPPTTQQRRRRRQPEVIAADGSNLGAFELAAIERLHSLTPDTTETP